MFILQSLLLTLPLLFKMHQLHTLFNLILHHMFLLQCLPLILPLLLKILQRLRRSRMPLILLLLLRKILQRLRRSRMPLWTNPTLILRSQWQHFLVVLKIINIIKSQWMNPTLILRSQRQHFLVV
jgi:hypothetical protein